MLKLIVLGYEFYRFNCIINIYFIKSVLMFYINEKELYGVGYMFWEFWVNVFYIYFNKFYFFIEFVR